jgi:hypothetical protein
VVVHQYTVPFSAPPCFSLSRSDSWNISMAD